ncbi:MAG TPA: nitroreductase family deazaflavin-dependent oxidoreductase [Pilimelia sp.]|nr:nitroreductase family deazaflavin-dependent oxidoreductase [Pilimelia sp.]
MPLSGTYAPSPSARARRQAETYEATGGAEAGDLQGKPVVVLTTVGARTGKLRKTPLMRVAHGGQYAVVASMGGADTHPAWYHNVRRHPRVELQDGPERHDYVAHEAQGAERDLWWARVVEAWPDYAAYQRRTRRRIPVLVLTRADA